MFVEQFSRQVETGDFVGPVRTGIESRECHLYVGQIPLDGVEVERGGNCWIGLGVHRNRR